MKLCYWFANGWACVAFVTNVLCRLSTLLLSCAEKDVNISFKLRAGTFDCPFILSSFIRLVFYNPETPDESLMNLWRMMIQLSSTGRTWHIELKTRWHICFWSAWRRRGGWVWYVKSDTHRLVLYHVCGAFWSYRKTPSELRDIMQDDEQVLQPYCTSSSSGSVRVFKAERSHLETEAALRIHSHYQNTWIFFPLLNLFTFIISKRQKPLLNRWG